MRWKDLRRSHPAGRPTAAGFVQRFGG
jgi:hypothetical protein